MKKMFVLFLPLIMILTSCDDLGDLFGSKKDDDSTSENGVRLKKIVEYESDGVTLKSQNELFYTDGQLTKIDEMEVNDEGILENLQTRNFSYINDGEVEEELVWKGSTSTPFHYSLSEGHIVKIENKDMRNGSWLVEERWEYKYAGGLLVEYLGSYDNEDGSTTYYGKADYFHNNGVIQNVKKYIRGVSDWGIWYQDSIFSSSEKIDSMLRYNQSGRIIQKTYFYYHNTGLLESVEGFNLGQNALQFFFKKSFMYDADKNLDHVEVIRNNNTAIYKLEWEKGSGNEKLFWKAAHQIEPGMPVFP